MITLAIGSLVASIGIYFGIVLWPLRLPKYQTVTAVRRRGESERRADYREGNIDGR